MRSMQVTEFGEPLEWRELPTPQPEGGEVLLEVVTCGICHSDLHLWEGYYELGGGNRLYVGDRGVRLPLTLGHEVVGRVVAAGPEAGGVAVGDLRLVYPWIGCGGCRLCEDDTAHLCSHPRSLGVYAAGGYSDHLLVPDARFLIEIGDLPPESAASYACAGLTAYSALRKVVPLDETEHLLLIGAGGVGLMAAQLVAQLTSARVILVDVDDRKLAAAREHGDVITLNSRSCDAQREVRRLTGGPGVAAAIDFVGMSETARLGFSVLAKNGTLVVVGLFGGELTVPLPTLPLKNVSLRGSYTGSVTELRKLIGLVRDRGLRPLQVACHPLDEVSRLLEELRQGRIVGRAVVRP